MYQGEASTSAGKRPCVEASSSEDPSVPRRRGYTRRGGRGGRVTREEPRREPEVEEGASAVPLEVVCPLVGRVPRSAWPHGPHVGAGFAAGWTGSNLILDSSSHISQTYMCKKTIGYMRTFSGYSSVFWAYNNALSRESKAILSDCAFGPLIEQWLAISVPNPTANLMLLHAFLDRYWDTTNTFHLPGFEAGISFSSFGIISGLPCGLTPLDWDVQPPTISDQEVIDHIEDVLEAIPVSRNKAPFLIKTSCIVDYFQGKGKRECPP